MKLVSLLAGRSLINPAAFAVRMQKAREITDIKIELKENTKAKIRAIKCKLPKELFPKLTKDELTVHQWRAIARMTAAGLRLPHHLLNIDPRTIIPKKGCVKALSVAKRKSGGRNFSGKICTRHIGGGFKRRIRLLDRHRNIKSPQTIVRIEHDPNRSAKLALLQDSNTKILSYVIATQEMKAGEVIKNNGKVVDGACLTLGNIPVGTRICNIETLPMGGGKMVRAAGTFATLAGKDPDGQYCHIKLPSDKMKRLLQTCKATVGSISNPEWHLRVIGKAGRTRNLGIRPTVRGVAMNAVDHPHGGGKGGRGKGKPSQSPWGKICK